MGTIVIGVQAWELFVGYNGNTKVFSFVTSEQISVFESDIKPFFDYTSGQHDYPADEQYLISTVSSGLVIIPRQQS